jgi:predicted HD phosphohydrolase
MDLAFDPDELETVLHSLVGLPALDEPVDQLTHALQTAGHALVARADDAMVIAALLHDVGRSPLVDEVTLPAPHERRGAQWCVSRFGTRVAWLVGAHVAAKRVLVATDPDHRSRLSPASMRSLAEQGGAYTSNELELWYAHPWADDACQLRRWDDSAKAPGAPAPAIDMLLAVASRLVAAERHVLAEKGRQRAG